VGRTNETTIFDVISLLVLQLSNIPFHAEVTLRDTVQLCISHQSTVTPLSDQHNCVGIMYLAYIRHCYIFRQSTSAIIS
jgi:predicted transcriptional regulator